MVSDLMNDSPAHLTFHVLLGFAYLADRFSEDRDSVGHRCDKVRRAVRDRTSWEKLVQTVLRGPPLLFRPFDAAMNTIEFFIHVEDVRRAQAG